MEEGNKYWLDKEYRNCVFCGIGMDRMEHYVEECQKVCSWFRDLREDKEEIWRKLWSEDLDSEKCKILNKLKREKEKEIRKKRTDEERIIEVTDIE
ncbi:hypothetical protein ALC56_03474 [Trachymyrmex septentrionalis]|uniref:Uncharacterized protein n=1 Tax=Trachymyrmex septentrionalis TaxID=34720 RepID=A0A195FPK5_9HYME|nr:hypothetical protein ALC56_03474 [Trachymyrmex septentrionalis]